MLEQQIEKAFDFRGDVTLNLRSGEKIEGFLFNRVSDASAPYVEIFPKDSDEETRVILYEHIDTVELSGKDMAAGRTWENWLRQVEKAKAEGKIAQLYPEELD